MKKKTSVTFDELLAIISEVRKRKRFANEHYASTVGSFAVQARTTALCALEKTPGIKRLMHEIARTMVELAHLLASAQERVPDVQLDTSVDTILEQALRETRSMAHSGRLPDYYDRHQDIRERHRKRTEEMKN